MLTARRSTPSLADSLRFGLLALVLALFVATPDAPVAAKSEIKAKFDPHSKSYFAIRGLQRNVNWIEARRLAEKMEHNGIRGRLAMVRDAATHQFLEDNFNVTTPTWIGMRYWCRLQRTKWINGEDHDRRRLSVWANPWYRKDSGHCGGQRVGNAGVYMPVYYTAEEFGFRWRATSLAVTLATFFVEFPPPEDKDEDAAKDSEEETAEDAAKDAAPQ